MSKIGTIRLVTYKRIGRACNLELLKKLLEESEVASKSKSED
ncbi:MAG: hypothetical protein QXU81_09875 [Candidatus Bathyarchaeia archaeon]